MFIFYWVKKLKTDENSLKQDFISVAENKLQTQTWKIAGNDNKLFIGSNKGLGFLNEKDEYLDFIDKKITGSIYTMANK